MSALDLVRRLQESTPSICADPSRIDKATVIFNPLCLRENDVPAIVRAVRALV